MQARRANGARRLLRVVATLVVVLLLAGLLAVVLADRSAAAADPQGLFSSGCVAVPDSGAARAVLGADGMMPGQRVGGDVILANRGDAAGRFSLSPDDLADRPGPDGGSLAHTLVLTVTDVTVRSAPVTVYQGSMAAMPSVDLGRFVPGESHVYRFTVEFPAAAGAHYTYTGSALSVAFVWTAVTEG